MFETAGLSDNLQGGIQVLLKRRLPEYSRGPASAGDLKGAEAAS